MKGVILSMCPNVTIVDISHEIRKFDVRMGAFVLSQAAPYFPAGTIHVAVVDPGVGTERRPILVETKHSYYVGPDNGLLIFSAQKEGIRHIYEIINPKYMLRKISRTFHGRDIFSCTAAYLAKGVPPSEFGSKIDNPIIPDFVKPVFMKDGLVGEVIHIDDFGNLITNISFRDLEKIGAEEGKGLSIKLGDIILKLKLCSAYGEAPTKTPLTIIGGSGFLEVSINQGNAAVEFNAKVGDSIHVKI